MCVCVCARACVCVCVFIQPVSSLSVCGTTFIHKQIKSNLNSEFSFYSACLIKAQERSLFNYLPIVGEVQNKGIFAKSNDFIV